jgi:hypothetical protein
MNLAYPPGDPRRYGGFGHSSGEGDMSPGVAYKMTFFSDGRTTFTQQPSKPLNLTINHASCEGDEGKQLKW